ncbi:MAG: OmpA family protein [Myxococcota bacterium]
MNARGVLAYGLICLAASAWAEEGVVGVAAVAPAPSRGWLGRSLLGGSGLPHVRSASLLGRTVSFSAHGGYFRQEGFTTEDSADQHYQLTVGGAFAPTDWLEISAASKSANHLSGSERAVALNDFHLRVKGGTRLADDAVAIAAELGLRAPPPTEGGIPFADSLSPSFGALFTYDFQESAPLRLHANAGFVLDNSRVLSDAGQAGRRFALGISDFNRVELGAAVEGHFAAGNVKLLPFLEYGLDMPLGASAGMPMRLSPGVRVLPWKGFFVDASVDLGLTPQQSAGVSPVPALMGMLALGYHATLDTPARVVQTEKVVEAQPKAAPSGVVKGVVKEAASGKTLADAVIALPGRNRLLADATGAFIASDVAPGPLVVRAELAGYKPAEAQTTVLSGKEAQIELLLAALPPPPPLPAILKGTVVSEKDKKVIATVAVPSAAIAPQKVDRGEFQMELPSGEHNVEVDAQGFLKQGRRIVARPGETIVADFVLREAPKKLLVVLKKEKIEIKKQVHFATNLDVILPDSAQLLDQVAATILENPQLTMIRIEGHTDSQGEDAYNMDLSERRARSVYRALLERGVDPVRLKSQGLGETKPIASNKNAKGRQLNRRVEFMIEAQIDR